MIVLGLLLILLAIGLGTVLFLATVELSDPVRVEAFGIRADVLPLGLLIAGAAVMFLLWLGLVMLRLSVRHKARRRRETKELQRQTEREAEARREAEEQARTAPPVPAQRFAATDADETREPRSPRDSERGPRSESRSDLREDRGRSTAAGDASRDETRPADRTDGPADRTDGPAGDAAADDRRPDEGTDPRPGAPRSASEPTVADRVMHRDEGRA